MFNRTLQQRFSRQACPEPFLCQDKLRRRDAKPALSKAEETAKKNNFLFLLTWRPLRLCASHRSSDSLNPNLTENFKYLWIVFVYHEAHEDHEEFTIKLYRPLRFKPRGRYNLITWDCPAVDAAIVKWWGIYQGILPYGLRERDGWF